MTDNLWNEPNQGEDKGWLEEVFGKPGSPPETSMLGRARPGYRVRPGQLELVRAVVETMRRGGDLLVEAPCGSGKSYSALIPLILGGKVFDSDEKRRPAVFLTKTIALQEQVIKNDLPTLQDILGTRWPFSFGLLKGRSHYLCLRELAQMQSGRKKGVELSPEELAVIRWANGTLTGDRSDLPEQVLNGCWSKFSVTSDDCGGSDCPLSGRCWANHARILAMASDIIVSNYHAAFAGGAALLDVAGHVVCDEAHNLADVAREAFGQTTSKWRVYQVANLLKQLEYAWVNLEAPLDPELLGRGNELRELTDSVFQGNLLPLIEEGGEPQVRLCSQGLVGAKELVAILRSVGEAAARIYLGYESALRYAKAFDKTKRLARSAMRTADALERADELRGSDKRVYWLERRVSKPSGDVHVVIEERPFIVGELLNSLLFARDYWVERNPEHMVGRKYATIMMSATLRSSDGFGFVRREVGAPEDASELVVPSPFNAEVQAALVVPKYVPLPPKYRGANSSGDDNSTDEWEKYRRAVSAAAAELIRDMGGRTLCLFTSWTALDKAFSLIERAQGLGKIPGDIKLLRQRPGEPVQPLVREFIDDPRSVLFGVDSLWQGVDVPGDALKGLFIDKIPFPRPNDPISAAVTEWIDQNYPMINGRSQAFGLWSMARATTKLQQGFGRLIRSETDTGVFVIADQRLTKYKYGKQIAAALPRMARFNSLAYAEQVLPVLFKVEGEVMVRAPGDGLGKSK